MKRLAPTLVCLASVALSLCQGALGEEKKGEDITGAAWKHFNAGRYDEGLAAIEKALPELEPKAKQQAATMRGFDAKGHEWDHGAVNISGTLWLIRGRILEKQGKAEEALAAFQECVARYPFSQAWDPAGWFWHPGEDAKKRAYKSLLRTAITSRKLEAGFFPEKEDAFDIPAQRTAVSELAGELLAQNDFAALDDFAESVRRHHLRFSNGDWMLHWVYLGIAAPVPAAKDEQGWEKWQGRIAQWRRAAPDSVTAPITEAHFLIKYAWRARGTGYANTVKPEAWERFGQRIASAAKLLEATPRTCPEWYQARLIAAMAASMEPVAYDQLFEEGWKAFPGYSSLVEAKTYHLLPRWHGEPGDWQRFAESFARKNGAAFYPIAVRYAALIEGDKAFEGIDRELLREGWEARIKERPGSLALLHGYAQTLARIKDPHAAEWLDKLGETYHAQTWPSYSRLEEARLRAKSQSQ